MTSLPLQFQKESEESAVPPYSKNSREWWDATRNNSVGRLSGVPGPGAFGGVSPILIISGGLQVTSYRTDLH